MKPLRKHFPLLCSYFEIFFFGATLLRKEVLSCHSREAELPPHPVWWEPVWQTCFSCWKCNFVSCKTFGPWNMFTLPNICCQLLREWRERERASLGITFAQVQQVSVCVRAHKLMKQFFFCFFFYYNFWKFVAHWHSIELVLQSF